jgi:tRNA G18 (ribose-2'-O)-methylase SpoU
MNPTNIGAIFRSAAALGIDAVLITPNCCDPLNRRAVRVSMGTVFLVPWAVIGKDNADWEKNGQKILGDLGYKTVAMALTDNTVDIDDKALASEEGLAIILGTEGTGLQKNTIERSDYTVKIPMSNGVDSLNVGAAAAIAFWELTRKK